MLISKETASISGDLEQLDHTTFGLDQAELVCCVQALCRSPSRTITDADAQPASPLHLHRRGVPRAVCPLHRALRLSRVLAMQDSYDLWQARQSLVLSGLTPMELAAA